MPQISPYGSHPVAMGPQSGGAIVSLMGAVPAGMPASGTNAVAWMNATKIIVQDFTSGARLKTYDTGTLAYAQVDGSGANALGAGANVWAAQLGTVRTNVGGEGPFSAVFGAVSELGQLVIVRFVAPTGVFVYGPTGTLQFSYPTLVTFNYVRLRQNILSFVDKDGWHLIDVTTGTAVPGYVQQIGVGKLVPFTYGTAVGVMELGVNGLGIRPARSMKGLAIPTVGTEFNPDIQGVDDSHVRVSWSLGAGELAAELIILDVNTATGATSRGTVVAGAVVFATGPTLVGTTFSGSDTGSGYPPVQHPVTSKETGLITRPWEAFLRTSNDGLSTVVERVNNLPVPIEVPNFAKVQNASGVQAAATIVADTLTLTSVDGSIVITPDQATESVNLKVVPDRLPVMPGPPGTDGDDGLLGPPGLAGPAGSTGATGATGPTGPRGATGLPGDDGDDGMPGPAGPVGATGATGPTGPTGLMGAMGLSGDDGDDGMPGQVGAVGATGATGAAGATGPSGLTGPPGFDGDDGDVFAASQTPPNSGVTAGAYGDASNVAQVTVDQFGRVTAATNVAITGGGASSAVPIVVTANTTLAANTGWVVPTSLKVNSGVSLKVASGAVCKVMANAPPFVGFSPAVLSQFAWINQGGAFTAQSGSSIFMYAPPSATTNLRIMKKTAPKTPYFITAVIDRIAPAVNTTHQGIIFRESSSGKLYGLFIQSGVAIGNYVIAADNYASPTSASDGAFELAAASSGRIFLRMGDDGINRTTWWSPDGVNFILLTSVGRTSTMIADEVGFYVKTETASAVNPACMTLVSWRATNGQV